MALAGKIGAVYRTTGTSTTFTDDATTADATKTRYTITNTTKRYWDDTATVTVKKNAVIQTSGYTLEYAGGVVVFAVALTTETILVSGKYFSTTQSATFFNWKLDMNADLKDVTTFASNGWKEMQPVIKSWTASADGYYADDTLRALIGTKVILVLYIDSGANARRYEGYIIFKKCSVETPADDVVKESIDFEGTGPLYYRASA